MTKVREIIKLEKEINLLCDKILHNLSKGEFNETPEKEYRELVEL